MRTTKLLVIVAVLQGLTLATLWERGAYQSSVRAQLPDSHAEQVDTVTELRDLNKKMDRLLNVLEGGKLEVKVTNVDDKRAK